VDEIDRELTSALSIEPSPEFRARVRVRIAERPRPWFPQRYMAVVGGAALFVAIAMAVGLSVRDNVSKASLPALEPRSRPAVTVIVPPTSLPVPGSVSAVGRPGLRVRVREPEVLIAPNEARGLRRLQAIVEEGRIAFVFLTDDARDPAPEAIREIVVAPIVIAPLEMAAISETVGNSEGDQQ
jgi:hypothetical protein